MAGAVVTIVERERVSSAALVVPTRLQLRRTKGWRKPANTVVVSRPGPWGNPFRVTTGRSQAAAVALYDALLQGHFACEPDVSLQAQQEALDFARAHRSLLRGKHLACWCRPGTPCHADALLRFAAQAEAPALPMAA